jgi:hypothetical protein
MHYNFHIATRLAHIYSSGYWKVADRCFFDKAECFRFASEIQNYDGISYHFFDEVYNSIDWTINPVQSLDSMYADRAKQIREKYKYVCLMFSGGSDSDNMLKVFLKNNIHIDEIFTVYPIKAIEKLGNKFNINDRSTENLMFEYIETVVPTFEYLAKHYPKIKLTVIDYTTDAIDVILQGKLHSLFQAGTVVSPYTVGWFKAYEKIHALDKDACLVFGVDKPRLTYFKKEDKFKSYFSDFSSIWGHWPRSTFGTPRVGTELFYYSPSMPLIPIKQCKQIEQGLRQVLDPTHPLHNQVFIDRKEIKIVDVHQDYVKSLLYPDWNTKLYQVNKPSSLFFPPQTKWISSMASSQFDDFYKGQLNEIIHGISPKLIEYDKLGRPSKLKEMSSSLNII